MRKKSLQDSYKMTCKILPDIALILKVSCKNFARKALSLQKTCMTYTNLARILQETNASCKKLARSILFVQQKRLLCKFFTSLPMDFSRYCNEGFRMLVLQVALRKQNFNLQKYVSIWWKEISKVLKSNIINRRRLITVFDLGTIIPIECCCRWLFQLYGHFSLQFFAPNL